MRYIFLGLFIAALAGGLARDLLAEEKAAGTVTGFIEVQKTRVKTTGPKSFKDVVVFLEPVTAVEFSPPTAHAVMDQRGLVFIPHVLAIQKGTTVDFLNSDNDRHNVFFLYDNTGETLDIGTWGPGQSVSHTFKEPGVVITLCQLHLEMAAYIIVLEHPFFTVAEVDPTEQRARYEIKGVPAGEYTLKVWHKKLKLKDGPVHVSLAADETKNLDIAITR